MRWEKKREYADRRKRRLGLDGSDGGRQRNPLGVASALDGASNWQWGRSGHEVRVDGCGCATAFVDTPDDEGLASPAITSSKDVFVASVVVGGVCLDVASRVLLKAELLDGSGLGAEETKCKKAESAEQQWSVAFRQAAMS